MAGGEHVGKRRVAGWNEEDSSETGMVFAP